MRQVSFTSLRFFVSVCEEGSIAKAAERESIVPSAVSKRLSNLEAMMDVLLLNRLHQGVSPTAAGEALLFHARSVLNNLVCMKNDVSTYAEDVQGHIRMFANISARGFAQFQISESESQDSVGRTSQCRYSSSDGPASANRRCSLMAAISSSLVMPKRSNNSDEVSKLLEAIFYARKTCSWLRWSVINASFSFFFISNFIYFPAMILVRLPSRRPNIDSKRFSCEVYKHFFPSTGIDQTVASCDYPDEAKAAISDYIEVYYNRLQPHQPLSYRTPTDVEAQFKSA